jgi:hypothetical protein
MKKHLAPATLLSRTILLTCALSLAAAQTNPPTNAAINDTSAQLRGYGKIHLTSRQQNGCTLWTFEATSATNASTTAGKFLADLDLSPGVVTGTLDVQGKPLHLVTVPGGKLYTGYASGNTGYVLSAGDQPTLQACVTSALPATTPVVTTLTYPPYLDRFDRHGWGFYGFAGNFGPKNPKQTDPQTDMDFLAKYKFRFELWPEPGNFDDNYSVSQSHTHGWLLSEAEKLNVPVSARLYGALPHVKEFTDLRDQQAPFMEGGWYWSILGYRDFPRQSWFNPQGRLYIARQAQQEILKYADHPEIESWMMPYGEVGTYDWYTYHGDISPSALNDWHQTIRNNHLSLAELSAMYARASKPFHSYDEVPIPEVATFAGLPGMVQNLEGDWYTRLETKPGEGLAGQWWNADVHSGPWDRLHMPGSVFFFKFSQGNVYLPKWMIHDFDFNAAANPPGKPVYLYEFSRATGCGACSTTTEDRKSALVYLNGQPVGAASTWGAWDVTALLKPRQNRVAIQTDTFDGRVFLSTNPPSLYPYLGAERNKLWVLFNNWLLDGRYAAVNTALAGMREVEPNKPIKIMVPPFNEIDRWLDTSSRFGTWGQFTGEGPWSYFWYKRNGFLYGLPGTSEGINPWEDILTQYQLVQHTFLEGLNGHEQVFTVQHITSHPAFLDYYRNHLALLKQMGRYDIAGPQVILYRSMNQATQMMPAPLPLNASKFSAASAHEIQTVWNWDFGTGTFQAIGQSALYVDNGGLAAHKIETYKLMVDSGNEIMTPDAIRNIGAWVRNGGTYIVLPFTGRSGPLAPDSWPIDALTGCKVTRLRTPGPGKGAITIAPTQPLFKELAGRTFPDDGTDVDEQGSEHNFLSVELQPGPDSQVIATYDNGAPAIVLHKLGRGQVIVLGSTFFRHIHGKGGLWLTDEHEPVFFRDLFTQLGFPSPNYASDQKVLVQRYRTNNGLDDVVVATSFAGQDRTVDYHITVDRRPDKVYQVALNDVREIPFTLSGNHLTLSQVAIPKDEVQVFYLRTHSAQDAVNHWWQYQNKLWKPTQPVKLDMTSISTGRFIDKAIDLKTDWHWTQQPPTGEAWMHPDFNQTAWHPWVLDIFNAVGADPAKAVYARKTFTVDPAWLSGHGLNKIVAVGQDFSFAASDGRWEMNLNGHPVRKDGFFDPDVSAFLHPGLNVLTLRFDPVTKSTYIGASGALYLTHAERPVKTIDLAGPWNANPPGIVATPASPATTLQFPGKASAFAPTRTFNVPAVWKQKYIVTYYVQGSRTSAIGAIVNETGVIRRQAHLYGDECEVDITPYLKFGQVNTLSMLSTAGQSLDPTHDWDIAHVELRLYPRSQNR